MRTRSSACDVGSDVTSDSQLRDVSLCIVGERVATPVPLPPPSSSHGDTTAVATGGGGVRIGSSSSGGRRLTSSRGGLVARSSLRLGSAGNSGKQQQEQQQQQQRVRDDDATVTAAAAVVAEVRAASPLSLRRQQRRAQATTTGSDNVLAHAPAMAATATATRQSAQSPTASPAPALPPLPARDAATPVPHARVDGSDTTMTTQPQHTAATPTSVVTATVSRMPCVPRLRGTCNAVADVVHTDDRVEAHAVAASPATTTATATTTTTTTTLPLQQSPSLPPLPRQPRDARKDDGDSGATMHDDAMTRATNAFLTAVPLSHTRTLAARQAQPPPPRQTTTTTTKQQRQVESRSNGSEATTATTTTAPPLPTMSEVRALRQSQRAAARRPLHANAASLHAIALPTLVLDDATATSSLSQTQEQQQQQLPPRGQSVYAVFQHLLERERGAMHSALSGLDFTRFMWSSAEASRLIVVFFWFTVAQCRRGWLERLLMVRYERLLAAYQELYRHGHKERLPPLRVLDELVAELLYITPRWQALCAASQQQQQQQQQQAATTARGGRSSSSSERGRDYAMQLHHLVRDSGVCHTLVHMSRVYNNGSSCSSGSGAAVAAAAAAALLPDVRVVEALCRALDAFVCACDEHAQVVQYTERAFARMATLYGGIFVSLARDVKDVTLRSYAHAVVRITYYTLLLSFPGDAHASGLQQASFRADVYRLYHYWCAGLTETHVPTRHWPTPQACDYAERAPPLTRHTLSGNSSSTATAAASAGGSGTSVPATTAAAAASSLTSNDALHGVVASLTAARRGYFALHLTPQQLQQQRRVSIDVIASIVAPMTMTDNNNNNTTATTAAVTGRGCGGPASPVVPDRVWRSRRGSTVVGAEAAAQQYEAQQQRTCRVVTTTAAAAAAAVTTAMSPLALRSSATTPRLAHAAHYGSGSSSCSAGGRRVTDVAMTGLSLRGGGGSSSIGSCSLTTTTSAAAAAAAAASAAALSTAVVADEEAALLAASTAAAAAQAGDAYNYGANFARYVRHSTRLLHELDKRVAREHKKHLRRGRGTQRFTTTDAHNGGGATTTTAMTMAHTSMQRRASFAQPETPLHVFAVLRDAVGVTPRAMSLAGSAATRRSSVGVATTTTTMMAMASSTANVASNVVHAAPGRRLSMHSMQSSVCSEDNNNNNNTANNAAGSSSTTRGCTVRASDSMTDKTAQQHHSHRYQHNSSNNYNNYGHSIMVGSMATVAAAAAAGGGSGVCDGDEDNREDVDKDVALLTARRRRVLHDVDVRRSKLATTHTVAPLTDLRTLLQPEHEQQQQQQQGKAHKATTTTTTSHADAPASDNDEDNNSSDGGGHNSNNSHHDNGAQAAAAAAAAAQYVNTSLLLSFPLALCESGVRAYVCCVAGVRLPDVPLPSTIATLLQQMQSHAPALITTPPATTTTTATATATTMHDGSVPQHHHAQQQQQLPHHHHHHRHSDDDIVAEEAMRRAEAWADEVAAAVTRTLSKAQQVQRTRLPASSPFVHYYATHVLHVHVQDECATSHEQASTQQQQDETAAADAATTSTPRPTHCRGVRHAVAPRTHVMTIPRCDGVARPRRFARLTAEALQQQHALLDDVHRITARDRLSRHAYNVAHLRTAHTVHAVQSTAYTQRYRRWARHALALQPLQHTTATAGAAVADGHSGSSDTSSHDAEDAQMQQGNKNNTARRSDALVVGGGGVNGSSGSRFSPLLHSLAHNV